MAYKELGICLALVILTVSLLMQNGDILKSLRKRMWSSTFHIKLNSYLNEKVKQHDISE